MLTEKRKKNGSTRLLSKKYVSLGKNYADSDQDRVCQVVVNAVSAVLDGNDTSAATVGNDGDLLPRVTTEGKEERVQLLVIRFDSLDDIFLAFLGFL